MDKGQHPRPYNEPNGQRQTARLKTQIKSHFYDVSGWFLGKHLAGFYLVMALARASISVLSPGKTAANNVA